MNRSRRLVVVVIACAGAIVFGGWRTTAPAEAKDSRLGITWEKNFLTVSGQQVPCGEIKVNYLEAFCRAGSTDREWGQTVIPHTTELVSAEPGRVRLKSTLADGVTVEHELRAGKDEVDFRLVAKNPTDKVSEAHWAQPCVRVDRFTGVRAAPASEEYLPKGFIFLDGKAARLPVQPWATKARYVPGQVWCPRGVPRTDVNPRPLSTIVPTDGLIGCYSADDSKIMASAWEPYQELFQGVATCLHADFRIGGLQPGETKAIRGKLYVVDPDPSRLLRRYRKDFPEHRK
jgi:hypothetical protein